MIQTLKIDNIEVSISHDEFADNPRHWGTETNFVFYHRRYNFPNELDIHQQDYSTWDEMQDELNDLYKSVHSVYMLDHGGLSFSLSSFGDRWDSGKIGFIVSNLDWNDSEAAAKSELAIWDNYVNGTVFCFDIKIYKEPMEHRFCSGFYGYDHEDNGLIDCLIDELKFGNATPEQIDNLIKQIK